MKRTGVAIAIFCFLVCPGFTSGQTTYPDKPVQIIVPYAPGGSLDLMSRVLAEKFRENLGQPVLVQNKPGANGMLGATQVATSKPDGYNIYAAAGVGLGYFRRMNPSFNYGTEDFAAVASFAKYPIVVIANKELPVKTFPELLAHAKKNPNTLTYGTSGFGATGHLGIELLKSNLGIPANEIPHIPYPGAAPTITAILGNQVQFACTPLTAVVSKHIDSGEIRPLMTLSSTRSFFRPEIPSAVEAGFPYLALEDYLSFWLPAKTPPAIVKRLEDVTRKATEDKEVQKKLQEMYQENGFLGSNDLRKMFDERLQKLEPLIKKLGLTFK